MAHTHPRGVRRAPLLFVLAVAWLLVLAVPALARRGTSGHVAKTTCRSVTGHGSRHARHHRAVRRCRVKRQHAVAHRIISRQTTKANRTLTAPTKLAATPGDQRAALSWSASANATGYDIYRSGAKVGSAATTNFSDVGLVDGSRYGYDVVARGSGGRVSAPSGMVYVTPTDTTSPTVPGQLSATAGAEQISLSWRASSDNVGLAGYNVYRNGTLAARTAGTGLTITGLTDGIASNYDVTAYDSVGNVSAPSAVVFATPVASSPIVVPATPPATNWDPSGTAMPVGDTSGWHQVFADNFANDNVPVGAFSGCSWPGNTTIPNLNCTGLAAYPGVEAKWFAYPDGWSGTPSTGTYEPSEVMSIQNGMMNFHIHTSAAGVHEIAAAIPKIPGGSGSLGGLRYGRYVIRARVDPLHGYHAAFLLWPDSNIWPASGEIDFPEVEFDSTSVSAFMHWAGGTSGASQDAYNVPAHLSQWHTYEIDWTATAVSFSVDGVRMGNSTDPSKIPSGLMHWILQAGISFAEGTPANATAGNVQIDWVSAYVPG